MNSKFLGVIACAIGLIVTVVFSVLTRGQKKKQQALKTQTEELWRIYTEETVPEHKIQILQELINKSNEAINYLNQEIKFAKEQKQKLLDLEHDKANIFTPQAFCNLFLGLDLIEGVIDGLKADKGYHTRIARKCNEHVGTLRSGSELDMEHLDFSLPKSSTRGSIMLFMEEELTSDEFNYEGIHYRIDDWDYRHEFIRMASGGEIPLLVHYYEVDTGDGNLSLSRGKLKDGYLNGTHAFTGVVKDASQSTKTIQYFGIANIRLPNRGLLNPDNPPKTGNRLNLFLWNMDRHCNYLLAGQYELPDYSSSNLVYLPLQKPNLRSFPMSTPKRISIGLKDNQGCFIVSGLDFVFIFTVAENCLKVDHFHPLKDYHGDLYAAISLIVIFHEPSLKDDDLADKNEIFSFITSYSEEMQRQEHLQQASEEKKRFLFYCETFAALKRQLVEKSSRKILIDSYGLKQVGGYECIEFIRARSFPKISTEYYEKFGTKLDRNGVSFLEVKLACGSYRVARIEADTLYLQKAMWDGFSEISEATIYLTSNREYSVQEESLKRFRFGKLHNPELQQAILFPEKRLSFPIGGEVHLFGELNPSQISFLVKALACPDLCVLQGPPGTGKSKTVIELIRQIKLLNPESRILLCSQSHVAVDNLYKIYIDMP